MSAIDYLVRTFFELYIMLVLLRVWLQMARADFYNPLSQFVVKATQPIVGPLRRMIPSIGSIDVATLLLAYLLSFTKLIVLIWIDQGRFIFAPALLGLAAFELFKAIGQLLFWVLILRAIMSWVSQGRSPVEFVLQQLTEPMLVPIRRFVPAVGGLDLSMLVLFIGLQFFNLLVTDIARQLGLF